MDKPKKILVIGIVLMIVGIIVIVLGFSSTFVDPSQVAKKTVTLDYSDLNQTVNLKSGEYDIWFDDSGLFSIGPGVVTITDSNGNEVYQSSLSGYSESISVNNKNFKKEGNFKIDKSGDYNVETLSPCTLYLTEPINIATGMGICVSGILVALIGGIVMLLGIYKIYVSKKRQQAPYPGYPPQPPPQAPGAPPPPQGGSQYPCSTCGQPLNFVQQYQKWYCDRCGRYA